MRSSVNIEVLTEDGYEASEARLEAIERAIHDHFEKALAEINQAFDIFAQTTATINDCGSLALDDEGEAIEFDSEGDPVERAEEPHWP